MVVTILYDEGGSHNVYGTFVVKIESSNYSVKEVLKMYCHVRDHLLETYATDFITAETDSEIGCYVKPPIILLLEFVNELWPKKL